MRMQGHEDMEWIKTLKLKHFQLMKKGSTILKIRKDKDNIKRS